MIDIVYNRDSIWLKIATINRDAVIDQPLTTNLSTSGPLEQICDLSWTVSLMSSLPLSLIIGIILGDGRHGVAEHHIGVVKCLLHLHGTVWTPANIVVCWTQDRWSICVKMRIWPTCHYILTIPYPSFFVFTVPTWLQRVFNVEHGGPVSIHHVLLNLIFGNVATSIFYPDTRFQVVEVATVELKEFNEENSYVDVGTAHILPVVKLQNTQQKLMSGLLQMVKWVGIHSVKLC